MDPAVSSQPPSPPSSPDELRSTNDVMMQTTPSPMITHRTRLSRWLVIGKVSHEPGAVIGYERAVDHGLNYVFSEVARGS
jgi:hypothetical protein